MLEDINNTTLFVITTDNGLMCTRRVQFEMPQCQNI